MNSKLLRVLMVLFVFLSFTSISTAEEKISEEDVVLALSSQNDVKLFPKDPFKPMVVKKVIKYVRPVKTHKIKKIIETVVPVIKPLKLKITGICGNNDKRQAVVLCESKEYLLDKGQVVSNKFKVIEIKEDKLVVYSIKEERRRTFAL